ncbi:WD40-repeat-containing domain protein, partial [Mycena sp. CBHHK59/15]
VWNMSDGHATFPPLVQHTAAIMSLEFSDDDTLFASGSKDKTICIWETATGQLHCPPLEHPHEIVCMSFSKDGRTLASITLDNALTLWSVRDKTIKLGPLSSHNRKNVAVAFSPDGMHVATLCI